MTKTFKAKYRLVSREFGDPIYAGSENLSAKGVVDIAKATIFDQRDNPIMKLAYFRSVLKFDFQVEPA